MYQLQIQWKQQGEWENTVFTPRCYTAAKVLCDSYNKSWGEEHSYRIVPVTINESTDSAFMDDCYGG
jgi:hypothetical protein